MHPGGISVASRWHPGGVPVARQVAGEGAVRLGVLKAAARGRRRGRARTGAGLAAAGAVCRAAAARQYSGCRLHRWPNRCGMGRRRTGRLSLCARMCAGCARGSGRCGRSGSSPVRRGICAEPTSRRWTRCGSRHCAGRPIRQYVSGAGPRRRGPLSLRHRCGAARCCWTCRAGCCTTSSPRGLSSPGTSKSQHDQTKLRGIEAQPGRSGVHHTGEADASGEGRRVGVLLAPAGAERATSPLYSSSGPEA